MLVNTNSKFQHKEFIFLSPSLLSLGITGGINKAFRVQCSFTIVFPALELHSGTVNSLTGGGGESITADMDCNTFIISLSSPVRVEQTDS